MGGACCKSDEADVAKSNVEFLNKGVFEEMKNEQDTNFFVQRLLSQRSESSFRDGSGSPRSPGSSSIRRKRSEKRKEQLDDLESKLPSAERKAQVIELLEVALKVLKRHIEDLWSGNVMIETTASPQRSGTETTTLGDDEDVLGGTVNDGEMLRNPMSGKRRGSKWAEEEVGHSALRALVEQYLSESSNRWNSPQCNVTPLEYLIQWLIRLTTEAKELGIQFESSQVRVMLMKAHCKVTHMVQEVRKWNAEDHLASRSFSESMLTKSRFELGLWWADWNTIDTDTFAAELVALFFYTVDCTVCRHSAAEADSCWQAVEDEYQARCTDMPFKCVEHKRPKVIPTDTNAFGHNVAPWAIINWCLRCSQDVNIEKQVQVKCVEGIQVYAPFINFLDIALARLPCFSFTAFRGIRGRVTKPYVLGDNIIWPAFSSCSLKGVEARRFMGKNHGTFFTINGLSAPKIDFASWFPTQAEVLFGRNAVFKVQSRFSNTLLAMLESNAELSTMSEVVEDETRIGHLTIQTRVDAVVAALRDSAMIFEPFLKKYVDGTLSSVPSSRVNAQSVTEFIHAQMDNALASNTHERSIIIASGGMGKTSAMLAFLLQLSQNDHFFPVFVSLPSVPNFKVEGALDDFVLRTVAVTAAEFNLLSRQRSVFVLLDSLDEVTTQGITKAELTTILTRNPMIANGTDVVLSFRDELLATHGLLAHEVIPQANVFYLQPLTLEHDVPTFIQKACALLPGVDADARSKIILNLGLDEVLENPCVLRMACTLPDEILEEIQQREHVNSTDIYEAFIFKRIMVPSRDTEVPDENALAVYTALVTTIAITMANDNRWQLTIGEVLQLYREVSEKSSAKHTDQDFQSYLSLIPRRVENDKDIASPFGFWHKSIGEYIIAQAIFAEPTRTLSRISRQFSDSIPAVLTFFDEFGERDSDHYHRIDHISKNELVPLVQACKIHDKYKTQQTITQASNALCLLCAIRFSFYGVDFSLVEIRQANLAHAIFEGVNLRGAVFSNSIIEKCNFDHCTIDGLYLDDTSCEIPVKLDTPKHAYNCVAISPNGLFIALASHRVFGVFRATDGQSVLNPTSSANSSFNIVAFLNDEVVAVLDGATMYTFALHAPTGHWASANKFPPLKSEAPKLSLSFSQNRDVVLLQDHELLVFRQVSNLSNYVIVRGWTADSMAVIRKSYSSYESKPLHPESSAVAEKSKCLEEIPEDMICLSGVSEAQAIQIKADDVVEHFNANLAKELIGKLVLASVKTKGEGEVSIALIADASSTDQQVKILLPPRLKNYSNSWIMMSKIQKQDITVEDVDKWNTMFVEPPLECDDSTEPLHAAMKERKLTLTMALEFQMTRDRIYNHMGDRSTDQMIGKLVRALSYDAQKNDCYCVGVITKINVQTQTVIATMPPYMRPYNTGILCMGECSNKPITEDECQQCNQESDQQIQDAKNASVPVTKQQSSASVKELTELLAKRKLKLTKAIEYQMTRDIIHQHMNDGTTDQIIGKLVRALSYDAQRNDCYCVGVITKINVQTQTVTATMPPYMRPYNTGILCMGECSSKPITEEEVQLYNASSEEDDTSIGFVYAQIAPYNSNQLGLILSPPKGKTEAPRMVVTCLLTDEWYLAVDWIVAHPEIRNPSQLSFCPDGKTLVVVDNYDMFVLSFADGEVAQRISLHTAAISRVGYSPDGKILLSASLDRCMYMSTGGRPLQKFAGMPCGELNDFAYGAADNIVAFAGGGGAHVVKVKSTDNQSGARLAKSGQHETIWALGLFGNYLTSISRDGRIVRWSAETLAFDRQFIAFPANEAQVMHGVEDLFYLSGHPASDQVLLWSFAQATTESTVRLVNLRQGKEIYSAKDEVCLLAVDPQPFRQSDKDVIPVACAYVQKAPSSRLSIGKPFLIQFHQLQDMKKMENTEPLSYSSDCTWYPRALKYSHDGRSLLLIAQQGGKKMHRGWIYQREENISVSSSYSWQLKCTKAFDASLISAGSTDIIPENGRSSTTMGCLMTGSPNHYLILSLGPEDERRRTLKSQSTNALRVVSVSPNGMYFAAADWDAYIIRVSDLCCVYKLASHIHDSTCFQWSRDGSLLYSGSKDKTIRVWPIAKAVRSILGADAKVEADTMEDALQNEERLLWENAKISECVPWYKNRVIKQQYKTTVEGVVGKIDDRSPAIFKEVFNKDGFLQQ